MSYPRAVKPNYVLDAVNAYIVDLGAPALADVDRIVVSTDMKVGSYTIDQAQSVDGQPRNVTVTASSSGAADTPGTIQVTGLNAAGAVISESIIPNQGSTVAGTKAFASVTSVVGAGWVIAAGNDTIEVGFGDLVGLPAAVLARPGPLTSIAQMVAAWLGGAAVAAPAFTFVADEIEKNTVNASAGTYNGTKRLHVLIAR